MNIQEYTKILRQHDIIEEIIALEQIKNFGIVNDIFIITCTSRKYVLRIDPNESDMERFRKEIWCMEQSFRSGFPTSQALGLGLHHGHPYILLSYIDGMNGTQSKPESSEEIWKTLGQYAAKIHAFPVTGYGEGMQEPGVFHGDWLAHVHYNIESLTEDDPLLSMQVITMEQSKTLKEKFTDLLQKPFRFGLVHGDLALRNTIIDKNNLLHLIDWGSAEVHVIPHMDMREILNTSIQPQSAEFSAFLSGYGMTRNEFESIKDDIDTLHLLTSIDKVRWAKDRKPEFLQEKISELKKVLDTTSITA